MEQVEFFKCLADQTRLNILLLIVQKGERCVCDFTAVLDLSQPKISRHLALLRSSKIVQDRRQGQWIYYSLHPDLPQWSLDILQRMSHENTQLNFSDIDLKEQTQCCS